MPPFVNVRLEITMFPILPRAKKENVSEGLLQEETTLCESENDWQQYKKLDRKDYLGW